MKIAQFIASDGWGGAEKVVVNLCNTLACEHDVTALTYDHPAFTEHLDPRVRHVLIPRTSRHNPRVYWALYRALKAGGFDIVHTHCAKATEITHRLRCFLNVCHVATKHNPRKGKVFEKVRHVTAVSAATARTVPQGATVIYNGIEPLAAITPGNDRHTPFRMLAVGRLDPIKGFDRLVEQVARLPLDFRLEIVGDGPQRERLQHLIDESHLTDKVALVGHCSNVPERMSKSDLVIISSHSEGFPLVLVEALFYAPVLISTPISDAPDLLVPELLSPQERLADKIMEVATDYANCRARFRAVQAANRARFMIETVAKSYLSYYDTVRD